MSGMFCKYILGDTLWKMIIGKQPDLPCKLRIPGDDHLGLNLLIRKYS